MHSQGVILSPRRSGKVSPLLRVESNNKTELPKLPDPESGWVAAARGRGREGTKWVKVGKRHLLPGEKSVHPGEVRNSLSITISNTVLHI